MYHVIYQIIVSKAIVVRPLILKVISCTFYFSKMLTYTSLFPNLFAEASINFFFKDFISTLSKNFFWRKYSLCL